MKKSIISLAIVSALIATSMFTACKPSTPKVEAAQERVDDAQQNLKAAQRAATAEEWKAFKDESNSRIKDNENQIAKL